MAKRFRLRSVEPKESDLRRQIHQALVHQMNLGKVLSFICANGGGGVDRYGRPLKGYRLWWDKNFDSNKDFPDICVLLADGSAALIEVKRKGEKPTPGQKAFLDHHSGSHKTGVAYGYEDVLRICGL